MEQEPEVKADSEAEPPWTTCQLYGHAMVADDDDPNLFHCTDCGESYREE